MNRIRNKIIFHALAILYSEKVEGNAEQSKNFIRGYLDALKDTEQIPPEVGWYDITNAMEGAFKAGLIEEAVEDANAWFDSLPDSWK